MTVLVVAAVWCALSAVTATLFHLAVMAGRPQFSDATRRPLGAASDAAAGLSPSPAAAHPHP